MKKIITFVFILGFMAVITGCENTKSKAVEGTVVGGLLGAGGGAIIGSMTGNAGAGAGIGAGIGAVAGGLIGSQIEKKPAEGTATASTEQISVLQVIELSKQKTPDSVIIDKIKKTGSKFKLNVSDIDYLQKQGVSKKVVDAMLE